MTADDSGDDSTDDPSTEATMDPESLLQAWFAELEDVIAERDFERVQDIDVARDESVLDALSDLDGDLAPESIRAEVDHLLHEESPLTGTHILYFLVGIEGQPVEIHPPRGMTDPDTTVVDENLTAAELADRLPESLSLSADVRTEMATENAVVRATIEQDETAATSEWLVATENSEWLLVSFS